MIGISSFLASWIAIDSVLPSTITIAFGSFFISLIPLCWSDSLIFSLFNIKSSFLVKSSNIEEPSFSKECNLLILFLIVEKLVSVPPSHLSTT